MAMKKLTLVFLLCIGMAATSFATRQYSIGSADDNAQIAPHNNTTLYINKDSELSLKLISGNVSDGNVRFGLSFIDPADNMIFNELTLDTVKQNQEVMFGIPEMGNYMFKPTINVGFWVSIDGQKYYTTDLLNPGGANVMKSEVIDGALHVSLTTPDSEINFVINAYDPGQAPSGQPLPGPILTLTIGVAALLLWWRFHRKMKAARV